MAPTELLAEQHAKNFERWFRPLDIPVALVTGSLPARTRRSALEAVANGDIKLVVGTHALFQESMEFAKLGLVIVDEQHRFGVHQRLSLRDKGARGGKLAAPAHHDGDADSANAGDDGLRGPRRLGHRRAAAGPHAREDRGAAGNATRRDRRAHSQGGARGPPGVLGLSAHRGIRRAALPGGGGNRRRARRGAARSARRAGSRPHAAAREGARHVRVQGRQDRVVRRHHRHRSGRRRAERHADGHRERRAHGPRAAAPAARPRGPRRARESLRAACTAASCPRWRARASPPSAKPTTAS